MNSASSLRVLLVCSESFTHRGGVSRIVERLMAGLPDEIDVSLACPGGRIDGLAPEARRPSRILSIPEWKWTKEEARSFARAIVDGGFDLVNFHDGERSDTICTFPGAARCIVCRPAWRGFIQIIV